MEQAAGRGAHALAVVGVDALAAQHDGVGAGSVRGADDGAGVARIAHVGEHGDQAPRARGHIGEGLIEEAADRHDALGVTVWERVAMTSPLTRWTSDTSGGDRTDDVVVPRGRLAGHEDSRTRSRPATCAATASPHGLRPFGEEGRSRARNARLASRLAATTRGDRREVSSALATTVLLGRTCD